MHFSPKKNTTYIAHLAITTAYVSNNLFCSW